jgi:DNA helicase-4
VLKVALIRCPECNNKISDKANFCVNCGLPSSEFNKQSIKIKNKIAKNNNKINSKGNNFYGLKNDYTKIEPKNESLITFIKELSHVNYDINYLYSLKEYISKSDLNEINIKHKAFIKDLANQKYVDIVIDLAYKENLDTDKLTKDINKIKLLDRFIEKHNKNYIENKLIELKSYFDALFLNVDKNILLDEEQRKAIITDEDYCLIVAGAGSGKTTTMAAKAKYLVDKKILTLKTFF